MIWSTGTGRSFENWRPSSKHVLNRSVDLDQRLQHATGEVSALHVPSSHQVNILFVVPYTPNLIRVRPYQVIRHLRRRGHRITVATLWSSAAEQADLQRLATEEDVEVIAEPLSTGRSLWNTVRALPTSAPLQSVYCWQPTLAQRLWTLVSDDRFDVVHIEHLRGARFGLWLKQQHANGAPSRLNSSFITQHSSFPIPIVWDSVDCISYLFAQAAEGSKSLKGRLITRQELTRTQRYEGWLVRQFDRVLVTSPTDKAALEALAAAEAKDEVEVQSRVTVLPNGVDLEYFTVGIEPREPATLVFSGKMSYHANVTAALMLVQEIMPHVWAKRPEVQVCIVGKDPPREIRNLTQKTPNPTSVIVTGTVSDIRPYLWRATVAVAPLPYGAGIQNKVLEAMACGAPVVSSRQAISALTTVPGQDLLVADDAISFAQGILSLLEDPLACNRLGQAGRRYVEEYHAWDSVAEKLENIYQAVITNDYTPKLPQERYWLAS